MDRVDGELNENEDVLMVDVDDSSKGANAENCCDLSDAEKVTSSSRKRKLKDSSIEKPTNAKVEGKVFL